MLCGVAKEQTRKKCKGKIRTYRRIFELILFVICTMGFPDDSVVKTQLPGQEPQEIQVQSLGWEDLWRRKWHPLQYSCLGNPVDIRAWRTTAHGVAKSQTWLSTLYVLYENWTFLLLWKGLHSVIRTKKINPVESSQFQFIIFPTWK